MVNSRDLGPTIISSYKYLAQCVKYETKTLITSTGAILKGILPLGVLPYGAKVPR